MIDITIIVQAKIFLAAVLFGFSIGTAGDLWKIVWDDIWELPVIRDMGFWILAGIGAFVFTECTNDGTIRSYLFLGWVSGWSIYHFLFRNALKRIGNYLLDLLKKGKKTVKIPIGRRCEHGTKEKEIRKISKKESGKRKEK